MSKKILLAYGTRYGATESTINKMAEWMKEDFTTEIVDLRKTKAKEWPEVEEYEGIIVGSGIRMDRWKKEATKFLVKNKEYLTKNIEKVAVFVSCGTTAEKKFEEARRKYLKEHFEKNELPYFYSEAFAGVFDFTKETKFGFLTKKLIKSVAEKEMSKELEWDFKGKNDFRDWKLIKEFVELFKEKIE
ncbi:MAG: flavodoxin domain-containing protein [Candidatus Kariarchaeaceae archaeon]